MNLTEAPQTKVKKGAMKNMILETLQYLGKQTLTYISNQSIYLFHHSPNFNPNKDENEKQGSATKTSH